MTPTPVRCSFAGCARLGQHFEPDGAWWFCGEHYTIHLALRREELAQQRAKEKPGKRPDPRLMPCGTHAAYARHKARGEYPCDLCREAERAYQAARYARRKAS